MPPYCAAYGCSEGFKKGGQYTFHSFPKDEERRKKWVIALRRENFQPSNSSRICSKHFHDECFDREKFGATWLKSDAIPTLFDFPSHLQKTPITRKPPTKRSFADKAPDKREDSLPSGDEPTKKKQKVYRYPGDFNETELASPTKCKAALDLANNALQIKMLKQTKRPLEKKVVSLDSMVKLEFIGETAPPGTCVREERMSLIKEEIKTEDELFDSSQDPELQGSCSQVKPQLIGVTVPPGTGVREETMSLIKEEIKTEDELFDASEDPELQGSCSQLKFEFIEVKDEAGKLTWKDYHSKPILEGKPQLIGEMENKYENLIGDLGKNTDYFGSMSVDNLNKTLSPMHSFDDNPIGLSLCENRFRPSY